MLVPFAFPLPYAMDGALAIPDAEGSEIATARWHLNARPLGRLLFPYAVAVIPPGVGRLLVAPNENPVDMLRLAAALTIPRFAIPHVTLPGLTVLRMITSPLFMFAFAETIALPDTLLVSAFRLIPPAGGVGGALGGPGRHPLSMTTTRPGAVLVPVTPLHVTPLMSPDGLLLNGAEALHLRAFVQQHPHGPTREL